MNFEWLVMRREIGFTLIELLVVFSIVAMLVGITPVAFERMRLAADYRDTLRGVMADLRAARQNALATHSEVRFTVNLEQRNYIVQGQSSKVIPEPLVLRVVVAGTEVTHHSAGIRFFPDGGATGGSVEIVRPTGNGARIRVDWLSGRISLEALT